MGRPKSSGWISYSRISPLISSPTMVAAPSDTSSILSRPYTTIACWAPSLCSTRTWMPTRSAWNTPIRIFGAPAGLVRGPRILKIVRTPNSLRTGAACFMAAWWLGANMKPMPDCAIDWAICSGVRLMSAPSASITSALPEDEETLRPPCLATRAPAAAATNMAVVATRADDVEQVGGVGHRHLGRELAHDLGGGGNLADGFLFDAQAHGEGRDHGGRDLARHDLAEQVQHLVVKNLAVFDTAQQGFLGSDVHGGLNSIQGSSAAACGHARRGSTRGGTAPPRSRTPCGARP